MGLDVFTQRAAWKMYRRWLADDRVEFRPEPSGSHLDERLKKLSSGPFSSPNLWTDAYLAAFADSSGLTLVTLDKALAKLAKQALLLRT
jgi:predicted nucleic acid-binding protein